MTAVIQTASHPGETGHWYTSDGHQVTQVESAKGEPIKPTLVHARKLNLGPGVTTIIRCAAAPGLERWKRQQVALAALTNPHVATVDPTEPDADKRILRIIEQDADAQAKEAREQGTSFHAAIQAHFEGRYDGRDGWGPWVEEAVRELSANIEGEFLPELGCSHPLGYGTKADLVGGGWLVDFKGKDEITPDACKLRDEHFMQLAATREALRHHGHTVERCAIGFFSRKSPGFVLAPVKDADLDRGFAMFHALLVFWQMKNRHTPQWGSTAPKE